MADIKKMLEYAELLYKVAYTKTKDYHEAEDIVQETYLIALLAINKGKIITNMKAYLLKVLNNKFCDLLTQKNKELDLQQNKLLDNTTKSAYSKLQKEKEATTIRRELAYLSKIYREVMVQYYMENKSINEIASNLGISVNAVKSRLHEGRSILKEGVNKMESFTKSSYSPDSLLIIPSGTLGINNEPLSVTTGTIEQNILILAYEKPVTIKEISEKMGISSTYVEEAVEKLLSHDFMVKQKNTYFTNFLMIDDEIIKNKKVVQKAFIDETFFMVKDLFLSLIKEYKKTNILNKYNETQLYLYALLSIFKYTQPYISNTLQLLKPEDYPNRADGGKWIILFGFKTNNIKNDILTPIFLAVVHFLTVKTGRLSMEVWDTPLGQTAMREKNILKLEDIGGLLHDLHNEQQIYPIKMQLLPDLIKHKFITTSCESSLNTQPLAYQDIETSTLSVNIPIISVSDYETLKQLNKEYSTKYIEIMGERLIEMIKTNAIDYPKRINPVSPSTHLIYLDGMALSYVYKAAEEGIIKIESDKNYPVCMIVEGEILQMP